MRTLLQAGASTEPFQVHDIKQLAVYSDDGTLLALMWEREDGTTALTRAGEPLFESLASQMGIDLRTNVRCVTL